MIVIRRGRVLNSARDALFPARSGNGIALARTDTDNYIRARTPNVDCTNTHHTPTDVNPDDGSQTNRWIHVLTKPLPEHVFGLGWIFDNNDAIRTVYNIPTSITQYTARVLIPPPYFPTNPDDIPPRICILGGGVSRTVSGTGIRWGELFWAVGHYQIRCCPNTQVDKSACMILVAPNNTEYYFPLWGNVSQVDLTIQRVSSTQARMIASSSAGSFHVDIIHSLNYTHPYQVEHYLHTIANNCEPLAPIAPYLLKHLLSPDIQYTYSLPLDNQLLRVPIYLQIKSVPDQYVVPVLNVFLKLELLIGGGTQNLMIPFRYNTTTNLWEPTQQIVLKNVISATIDVQSNHILERVSVLMGNGELHYVPAPHQVEWMAVVPVEMEQLGIPNGIIPSDYDVLAVPDYARVLDDGTISVLPAEHARVITIHLRERLQSV